MIKKVQLNKILDKYTVPTVSLWLLPRNERWNKPYAHYLISTVESKKQITSLVRWISRIGLGLFLPGVLAGFIRIEPFIPK